MNKTRVALLIGVVVIVGAVLWFALARGGEQELVLGLVSPLTGPAAAYGETQQNAVRLAVDEINAQGGIGGKLKIRLVSEDDEGTPSKSVTVTQKLVSQDEIHVMIGAQASTCTLADMEITGKAGVPQIAPSSTALAITQQGNKYIFRNAAPDSVQTNQIMKYLSENGKKRIAVIYENTDYGNGGGDLIVKNAGNFGLDVTTVEAYNVGDKDFSVQLTKIKNDEPDAIIVWGFYSEGALLVKQVEQYGVDALLMGGTGFASPKFVELGEGAADGFIFSTPFTTANPEPRVQEFLKRYVDRYKSEPDMNAAQSYDAVYIIAKAVEKNGFDLNRDKIRDAIAATEAHPGASGTTSFDQNGEVIKDVNLVRIENGKYNVII